MSKESKQSKLEGLHYEILQAVVDSGDFSKLEDEEMVVYLEQLEKVRGWYYALQSERKIINALQIDYPALTERAAKVRYNDAMNYFYGDRQIKKIAYRNRTAEKIERLADAITRTAKEPKDFKLAADTLHKAEVVRGSMEPDVEKLPDHIFKQKQPVYVLDPSMLGLPKANTNELAKQIEQFAITELEKDKLLQEAGAETFNLEQRLDEQED